MDLLQELETLAVVVDANNDYDGSFNELFHAPMPMAMAVPNEQPSAAAGVPDLKSTYLVKLECPLTTPAMVQELAGMLHLPQQVDGSGDAGDASFCFVNGTEKSAITAALAGTFKPTFIRINRAEKALDCNSPAPCLNHDATLPHHRATDDTQTFLPGQSQYPAWYFFYGTLASPEVLIDKLELDAPPTLCPATVQGELRTWGGKYKALTDGVDTVDGWAYEVTSAAHEDVLRYYETDQYEVVRCAITMTHAAETVFGLTFRYVGACD
ncbi:gamma-glutamylcyclotransferase family protein [Aspergillus mulundensis]|uniref:Putative gamma-glutamylcyclotransferase n=1 Tax=Aspergillus mulundensis TaxID=1810919 RepID=A0A3D8RR29_9EURO|nr:Uncharacterized protein DSM5745_06539 [Aspergillus mulundensis]RDW76547.1 Uncharacterized protein DSM5745_06539 [Aspergillus mulundensis]